MAPEMDLLRNLIYEREYLEIDAKRQFYAVVSCIYKWQIASSEVSDEVYESNKKQYLMEAETLQSKLAEAYLRLEANIVYKLSSSEKKKRGVLMGELSYEINYLSDVTPIETDCNPTAAPPQGTEHADTDQLSTALQNIQVEHRDQTVTAIELTDQDSEYVEPTITEVENADETCKGYATADTKHTVTRRVTEEPDAYTEELDVNKTETAAHAKEPEVHAEEHALKTEEPDDHKEEPAACIERSDDLKVELADGCTEELVACCTEELVDGFTELPDVYTELEPASYREEPASYPAEPAAYKKEPAAYTEYTEQHLRAWPTAKTSTSTNSHSTIMQTQGMIKTASTDSNIEENRDDDIKVWHHLQNEKKAIKTSESMSLVIICCYSDYSNEICYLLLYS